MDENADSVSAKRRGRLSVFFREQFAADATPAQNFFDVVAGIIVPTVCVFADPIVFKGGLVGGALLGGIAVGAYAAFSIGTVALAIALAFRPSSAIITGILLMGAMCSGCLGLVLVPISALGLIFFLIGALGFTPFVVSFVYLRNAVRVGSRIPHIDSVPSLLIVSGGMAFAVLVPVAIQAQADTIASNCINTILTGNFSDSQEAVARLKRWSLFVDADKLVWAYEREEDPDRKAAIADAYQQIAGEDIEHRLRWLLD